MKRAVITDLDGVWYPFAQDFADFVDRPHEFPSWDFYKRWGLDTTEFLSLYADGYRQGRILHSGDPLVYPGMIRSAVGVWQRDGVELHVVTHRDIQGVNPAAVRATTEGWLDYHSLPYDHLSITGDKGLYAKRLRDRGYDIVAVIEDKPENLYELIHAAECPGFLIDQPWNQGATMPGAARVRTFSDAHGPITALINKTLPTEAK